MSSREEKEVIPDSSSLVEDPQFKEESEDSVKLEEIKLQESKKEGKKEGCATLMIKKAVIHRQRKVDEAMNLYAKMSTFTPDYEWDKDVKSCTEIAECMDNQPVWNHEWKFDIKEHKVDIGIKIFDSPGPGQNGNGLVYTKRIKVSTSMKDVEKWHQLYTRNKPYGEILISYNIKDHSAEEELGLAIEEERIKELQEIVAKEKDNKEKRLQEVTKLYSEHVEKEKRRLLDGLSLKEAAAKAVQDRIEADQAMAQ